jgi:ADP-dependent NAD(P)H-hydrate dehydratase / NAD(P)H-hydrate epimerase
MGAMASVSPARGILGYGCPEEVQSIPRSFGRGAHGLIRGAVTVSVRLPNTNAGKRSHRSGVWPLVTASEMQELDQKTINEARIPGEVLMESAGRGLVASVLDLLRDARRTKLPVCALCGAGNNGGDGFVLVRHLHGEGIAAEAILLGDPDRLPPDAALNWQRLGLVGAAHRVATSDLDWASLFDGTGMVVDALFGTGLARPVEGQLAEVIHSVAFARTRGLPVLSVDIPSGINADTGEVLGAAIEADRTLTISLPKIGLALEPGRSHAGDVRVVRVGIADPDPERPQRAELWNARAAARQFPARPRAGHKGSFGHVLVASGSPGKMGAAALCARAAVRAGAGLVTVAYPAGLGAELDGIPVEAMTQSVESTAEGVLASKATKALVELAASRDVVALGPGLGRESSLRELVPRFAVSIECPIVIDADGLHALSGQLEVLRERSAATVLTPHPGEAATLLGTEARDLNRNRIAAARELAKLSGAIVVLKGAGTVIADSHGRSLVTPTGGPALATGGTGDVLTGIIAALLGSGIDAFEAAALGAWWHGATADRLVQNRLPFGLLAGELADALPECATALVAQRADGEEEGEGEDLELRFPGH